ncbi:MAG: type II secretion system protein GspG [Verrucomicrobia bacterium]|nr:type II secretion system protein GspG [Kiritimatiellia bacterium]MCP5489197.1 type II secretion system protein GspG [Verrucomicrobiota bacterium]
MINRARNELSSSELSRWRRQMQQGFTLVELLVVMSIIGILVGLTIGIAGLAGRKSADAQAIAEIQRLSMALDQYRAEYGAYPNFGPALTNMPNSVSNDLTRADGKIRAQELSFIDPWGNGYRYTWSSKYQIEIRSLGADTSLDEDDLISGQQN